MKTNILIFFWTLAVHGAFLAGSVLKSLPSSLFFFGDSPLFLEAARRLVEGVEPLPPGLPYHPPLTTWLLTPLWWVFDDPASVAIAAKLLMAALSGITWVLFYRLLLRLEVGGDAGERRRRLSVPLLICLLGPLSFGELALNAAVSSEVPYRLLLVVLISMGWRWPLLAGALHGLAALIRAEHLPVVLVLAAVAYVISRRRGKEPEPRPSFGGPYLAWCLLGLLLVVVPYALRAGSVMAAYNRTHAEELAEPLPVVVPVSFYGPLNFALAQREAEIHFSRRTLPPPPGGGLAALDPTFGPHHQAVVHGYRLGLEEILRRPGRFLARTGKKLVHSLRALAPGWTWRELPRASARWTRQPVDIAHGHGGLYTAFALLMVGVGAWSSRRHGLFLMVGGGLLVYRLLINAAFFPYLRSILIVGPFLLALFWLGVATVAEKAGGRRAGALALVLVGLAAYHFSTVAGERPYRLSGERTQEGAIIDDRRVEIELVR